MSGRLATLALCVLDAVCGCMTCNKRLHATWLVGHRDKVAAPFTQLCTFQQHWACGQCYRHQTAWRSGKSRMFLLYHRACSAAVQSCSSHIASVLLVPHHAAYALSTYTLGLACRWRLFSPCSAPRHMPLTITPAWWAVVCCFCVQVHALAAPD